MNLILEYPWWFCLFCILAGFAYSFVLYRKDKSLNEISIWRVRLMAAFRFISITIITFFLLSPLLILHLERHPFPSTRYSLAGHFPSRPALRNLRALITGGQKTTRSAKITKHSFAITSFWKVCIFVGLLMISAFQKE